jgi:DivIVA domain-containing protein
VVSKGVRVESITGQDVLAYSFAKSRRGYDQAEVDQFVEVIAAELDRLNGLLTQRVGNEESAVLLLRTATRTADETIAEATAEAEQVRSSAAAEAAEMTAAAAEEAAAQIDEAQRQALEVTRDVRSEAARVSGAAQQQADEAEERVGQLQGLLMTQANRLRGEAGLMQTIAERLEAAVGDESGDVIDITQPLLGEAAGDV